MNKYTFDYTFLLKTVQNKHKKHSVKAPNLCAVTIPREVIWKKIGTKSAKLS